MLLQHVAQGLPTRANALKSASVLQCVECISFHCRLMNFMCILMWTVIQYHIIYNFSLKTTKGIAVPYCNYNNVTIAHRYVEMSAPKRCAVRSDCTPTRSSPFFFFNPTHTHTKQPPTLWLSLSKLIHRTYKKQRRQWGRERPREKEKIKSARGNVA